VKLEDKRKKKKEDVQRRQIENLQKQKIKMEERLEKIKNVIDAKNVNRNFLNVNFCFNQ
jgi:DNA-binding protein H-NS